MLELIVRFSIRHPGVVTLLAAALVAAGVWRLSEGAFDIFPEFAPRQVVIQTEAPGLTAEQVETGVTRPLEEVLRGLPRLVGTGSESIGGLSIVTLTFEDGTRDEGNRAAVAARLAVAAGQLHRSAAPPAIVPLSSSAATVMTVGFTAERDPERLRSTIDRLVLPHVLAVPGVADVNVFGGAGESLQVRPDPKRLARAGITIADVTEAVRAAGHRGTGRIDTPNQTLAVVVGDEALSEATLRSLRITRPDGVRLPLTDVADIGFGASHPISMATVGGEPAVLLMVIGQFASSTVAVTRSLDRALDELTPALASIGVFVHRDLFRPAGYVERSVNSIFGHLAIGAGLVVLVLLAFLFDVRAAVITASAIPVSLLAAALGMLETGNTFNIMVIGGLAIALGEVVDDAIIDTENIQRRLRQNRTLPAPRPARAVVLDASMEVRGSMVHASVIVMLVFVPLFAISGVAGRMFAPLALAYIMAIFASLVTALTLTPALCRVLLAARTTERTPPLIRWLTPAYAWTLRQLNRAPGVVIVVALGGSLAGVALLPGLGSSFLPELREGHYMIHTSGLPGTSLEETIRMGTRLTRQVLQVDGVRSMSQWAGRAERGADTYGSHYAEYEVELEPLSGREQQEVFDRIREILNRTPGIASELNTFLTERVDETVSGYAAPLAVRIFGPDLGVLDAAATRIAHRLEAVPGLTQVRVRAALGRPQAEVHLDWERLGRAGIAPAEVVEAVEATYGGLRLGTVFRDGLPVPVTLMYDARDRANPLALGDLLVRRPDGVLEPLGALAEIRMARGRYSILRDGGRRLQVVTAHLADPDVETVLQRVEAALDGADILPRGVYADLTGSALEQRRSREELIVAALAAGLGILILARMAIGRGRVLLLVLANLPFALVGGVVAAYFTGGVVSLGSLVGFVTLFGITLRNSIMLISHYRHLVVVEGAPWTTDTAIRGAVERLPSILMTALVTALAMLPIALYADNPGHEIMGPMAAIIIGGLGSSTLLNLLVLPLMMRWLGNFGTEHPESAGCRSRPAAEPPGAPPGIRGPGYPAAVQARRSSTVRRVARTRRQRRAPGSRR